MPLAFRIKRIVIENDGGLKFEKLQAEILTELHEDHISGCLEKNYGLPELTNEIKRLIVEDESLGVQDYFNPESGCRTSFVYLIK